MKILPTAGGVVISQTAQVYQPHIIVQPAVQVNYLCHFQHFSFPTFVMSQTEVTLGLFQALPLAQQLEAKPQTGPLAGIETVSVPVAPVATASVPAASTAATSGQAPPTTSGTIA